MNAYLNKIKNLRVVTFKNLREIAWSELSGLSREIRDKLHSELGRGTALLETHYHLCQYLSAYGDMHQAKLLEAFKNLPKSFFEKDFEVIDWGCGQAIGTAVLCDFLRNEHIDNRIKKITLIEPSKAALDRGSVHVSKYIENSSIELNLINSFFENIRPNDIIADEGRQVLHIFSNILDVDGIDLKVLSKLVDNAVTSDNIILTVGPLNPNNQRLDGFFRYFDEKLIDSIYQFEDSYFFNKWTYKAKIYRLEPREFGHLIPIEYYPTVQFQACYELDIIKDLQRKVNKKFDPFYTHFEVAAPFDLGASVYDDVHPILAVLNNIVSRGIPTKSSLYVEEYFSKVFNYSQEQVLYGEIHYTASNIRNSEQYLGLFKKYLDKENFQPEENDVIPLQLVFTPIAIARFQKMLIEAIITGHLSLDLNTWSILVEEQDIPFAYLALEDFKRLFYHLTQLSVDYDHLKLPDINLTVINRTEFYKSPLQGSTKVYQKARKDIADVTYDLVVTQAIFKSTSSEIESFSQFKAYKDCYFNIRTIVKVRTERSIYTSDLIKYKNLVEKTSQGNLEEIDSQKDNLTYFLQLFFRKESFRAGQLPILDRALQNLPVIGLLPTGGGKSLTYQIAALLQPGVTMIIDPLKSLMKDQFDGLVNSGIDCVAYINSSLSPNEKKEKERQLESSQLLMIFLSPERLSIATFRERLKNMHNYNVYFSYGVIDEVHCVSEWGHDFRFSYLHLGRNLYNYVRAKSGEISLFGLTATASFDVLADVERELSGNGAFSLDADVIVRYENSTRLELQYKIENVPIEFEVDQYYDKNRILAPHLPKAINISNSRSAYDSKGNFLKNYLREIPSYLKEVLSNRNVDYIKKKFVERQNNDEGVSLDLKLELAKDFFEERLTYDEAGIVFCPHVKSTGISVIKNFENLKKDYYPDLASFSGRDEDDTSMHNMERFRDNKSPLMIATKAFGMGIDKPNVRYTVNMNYSSSLEAFVQEAGRAGRDRKMALSTILVSDYDLASISRTYTQNQFPLGIIKNKWFYRRDLDQILEYYDLSIPDEFIVNASASNDIVKLHCIKDNKMFAFKECANTCSEFSRCQLKLADDELRVWKSERELLQELRVKNLKVNRKNFQYLNPDFQTIMFFFNESFKGDIIEKKNMVQLLNSEKVYLESNESKAGFLSSVLQSEIGDEVKVFIPYNDENYIDISKAIYRMCCIELIEDFTQDYKTSRFSIVSKRKGNGEYYLGLKRFLQRYYTIERSEFEIEKVKSIELNVSVDDPIRGEIYRCLSYLTEFVYDKISEKRKRAMDDMRNFCIEGLQKGISWIEANEKLKDNIFFYFNSKYAREDYVAENGEEFSLTMDTDFGKVSSEEILFKYLRVIDDEIVGVGTPLDNVKHLYGAVRLISRSLTDSNPALYLLEVFCLAYMGTRKNQNLENQLSQKYYEGMIGFSERFSKQTMFWRLFSNYNDFIINHLNDQNLTSVIHQTELLLHNGQISKIKAKYLD